MGVFRVKPHMLYLLAREAGEVDDAGDYTEGAASEMAVGACAAVPAGAANEVTLPDGTVDTYSYTLYLDPFVHELAHGDTVRIDLFAADGSGEGGSGRVYKVKGFHRYQHQCKVWV